MGDEKIGKEANIMDRTIKIILAKDSVTENVLSTN